MNNKHNHKTRPPNVGKAMPTREKYARAFRQGAQVVVHTEYGDEIYRVRKRHDGSFDWAKVKDTTAPADAA